MGAIRQRWYWFEFIGRRLRRLTLRPLSQRHHPR